VPRRVHTAITPDSAIQHAAGFVDQLEPPVANRPSRSILDEMSAHHLPESQRRQSRAQQEWHESEARAMAPFEERDRAESELVARISQYRVPDPTVPRCWD
jgi:hypothetical protein